VLRPSRQRDPPRRPAQGWDRTFPALTVARRHGCRLRRQRKLL